MMDGPLFEELLTELRLPPRDLSTTLAEIHVACIQLELIEPGVWWDFADSRPRLRHLAVIDWMERYQFAKMADLTPQALTAFRISLNRRIAFFDRALPHATEPLDTNHTAS
ncbi:MAG: hypothetical protein AAGC93_01675 [Cyanobacteria bacterium P01_F01_bin.53]